MHVLPVRLSSCAGPARAALPVPTGTVTGILVTVAFATHAEILVIGLSWTSSSHLKSGPQASLELASLPT